MIKQIKIENPNFPQKLKQIQAPPKTIYYQGNIELLNTTIISIIGSRKCSKNGEEITRKFAKELVKQGITIASGMALGIDTIAHTETLKQGGKTIAVLGNGLYNIFPEENIELYKQIIKQGGLVITEYPNEEKAKSKNFLERNRIVSGISIGILIIEAMKRSGTSVTASYAIEQDKKVFAIPHEINNKNGKGTNELIRKGAILVTKVKEIIEEFEFLEYKEIKEEKKTVKEEINKKECKNNKYKEIYKYINETPITIEEIAKKSKKKISEINSILTMMEIEEYIEKVAGGYKCKAN